MSRPNGNAEHMDVYLSLKIYVCEADCVNTLKVRHTENLSSILSLPRLKNVYTYPIKTIIDRM